MFEPRCPRCHRKEVELEPASRFGHWRCQDCGEFFALEGALIQIREALDLRSSLEVEPLFRFDRDLAERELRDPDGALRPFSRFSDHEEIDRNLTAAGDAGVIHAARAGARIGACSMPRRGPQPPLCVDPGIGPWLLGFPLGLGQRRGEDPISYTLTSSS